MNRLAVRLLFVTSAVAAVGVTLLAVAYVLGPQSPPQRPPGEIALVRLDSFGRHPVVRLSVKELAGLDRLADAERRQRGQTTLWASRTHPRGMPVLVVRVGDDVRAFLAVDPRTGCALEETSLRPAPLAEVRFVDVCHGTTYDVSGQPIRGPGMWLLDELVLRSRGGVLYAETGRIVAGGVAAR
ncbi:MAG TPA: hypothetical protein VJP45_11535 [Candidatus Limnocylindria bacterium]|nr:hypothetical protein [Candidatus Limnocylindria bacterium]